LGYSDEARWEYVTDKAYFRLADLDHPTKIDPSIFTTGKPGVDYGFVAALPYDGSGYWAAFMNATRLSDGANVTLEDGEPAIEISADHQLLARKSGDVVLLPGGRTPIVRMVADYAAERAHYQHCQKWRSQDAPPPLPAPLALASSPKEFRGELFSATLDHEVQAIPQHDGSVLYVYSEAGTSVALRGPTKLADALSQGWSHIIVRPTGAIVDLKLQKAVELDVVAIVDPVLCWHEVGLVDCTYTAGQYELPRH
jgi:hypothetical protein